MAKILLVNSMLSLLCGCWLATMELVLKHPGYWERFSVAIAISVIALSTILVLALRLGILAERWLWIGAIALIAIGGNSFLHNLRAAQFEGFVLLISLVLVIQGTLMLAFIGRSPERVPLAPAS
jgi:hypothetical protein